MTSNGNSNEAAYDSLADFYDQTIPDPRGFIGFYLRACAEVSGLLYVGCGTGRLLCRLAAQGASCVGVDPSVGMLQRAQERVDALDSECRARVELVKDRMPSLQKPMGEYEAVVVAGGAFEYLMTTRDQVAALRRLRDLLAPGGALLMDVGAPPFTTSKVRDNYVGEADRSGPGTWEAEYVESSSVQLGYDHFNQVLVSHCSFDIKGREDPMRVTYRTRYTTISEWRMLLNISGLRGQIFGGFDGRSVTRESSNFVIVAGAR